MKHSDHFDTVGMGAIINAKWEAPHHRPPNVGEDDSVHQRSRSNRVKDLLHGFDEHSAEPRPLLIIPIKGFVEFRLCFFAQYNREIHRRALARARALICSHGLTASGRAMLSARRRSNSARSLGKRGAASVSLTTLSQIASAIARRSSTPSRSKPRSCNVGTICCYHISVFWGVQQRHQLICVIPLDEIEIFRQSMCNLCTLSILGVPPSNRADRRACLAAWRAFGCASAAGRVGFCRNSF